MGRWGGKGRVEGQEEGGGKGGAGGHGSSLTPPPLKQGVGG